MQIPFKKLSTVAGLSRVIWIQFIKIKSIYGFASKLACIPNFQAINM
jgi:hypothetical protein